MTMTAANLDAVARRRETPCLCAPFSKWGGFFMVCAQAEERWVRLLKRTDQSSVSDSERRP